MTMFRISASLFIPLLGGLLSFAAHAESDGGVGLSSTRMIYPMDSTEERMGINNTSTKNAFLMQSWMTDAQGKKTEDLIITPPLFVLKPGKEGSLRITMARSEPLPSDRESLYYLNSKAIPSIDKSATQGKSMLQIAMQNTIKVFVRPKGLKVAVKDAPNMITCQISGNVVSFSNSSPYYVTLVDIKTGDKNLKNIMVPPLGSAQQPALGSVKEITYQSINDYGAKSKTQPCK